MDNHLSLLLLSASRSGESALGSIGALHVIRAGVSHTNRVLTSQPFRMLGGVEVIRSTPWALDASGILVAAAAAEPHLPYVCPSCGGRLFRRGGSYRPHFYHHDEADLSRCDFAEGETLEHLQAKRRIVEVVAQRLPVEIERKRRCGRCGRSVSEPLPLATVSAIEETLLDNGRRADVALFDGDGCLVAIVEVYAHHKVDREKARLLRGTPWLEVRASTVLESDRWILERDLFPVPYCAVCAESMAREQRIPFRGDDSADILCPKRQQVRAAVTECGWCKDFVEVTAGRIICRGGGSA